MLGQRRRLFGLHWTIIESVYRVCWDIFLLNVNDFFQPDIVVWLYGILLFFGDFNF